MNSYILSFVPPWSGFYVRNVCFHMKSVINIMCDLRFSQRSHPRSLTLSNIYNWYPDWRFILHRNLLANWFYFSAEFRPWRRKWYVPLKRSFMNAPHCAKSLWIWNVELWQFFFFFFFPKFSKCLLPASLDLIAGVTPTLNVNLFFNKYWTWLLTPLH
jgi:hypothetical protein